MYSCLFCYLLGAVVKQEIIKSCSLTAELTKKQLQSKAEKSLVARRALSQWNRMNTTIRGIVNNMQVWYRQVRCLGDISST